MVCLSHNGLMVMSGGMGDSMDHDVSGCRSYLNLVHIFTLKRVNAVLSVLCLCCWTVVEPLAG